MKDLFTIKIKDKEYVHIDTIKYKNQKALPQATLFELSITGRIAYPVRVL